MTRAKTYDALGQLLTTPSSRVVYRRDRGNVQGDRRRDSQRSKVYAAENAAFLPMYGRIDHTVTSLAELEAFVRKVTKDAWFQRTYTHGKVRPIHAQSGRGARGNPGRRTVTVAPSMRSRWIVLHEIAHVIANNDLATAWHGWEFCACYLALVRHFLGVDAAAALEAEFKARKVRYKAPRKRRPLTPEQRAANIARLAAYREAKMTA